jgi:hypothetical protein
LFRFPTFLNSISFLTSYPMCYENGIQPSQLKWCRFCMPLAVRVPTECQLRLWPFYLGGLNWSLCGCLVKCVNIGIKSLWCLESPSRNKFANT